MLLITISFNIQYFWIASVVRICFKFIVDNHLCCRQIQECDVRLGCYLTIECKRIARLNDNVRMNEFSLFALKYWVGRASAVSVERRQLNWICWCDCFWSYFCDCRC